MLEDRLNATSTPQCTGLLAGGFPNRYVSQPIVYPTSLPARERGKMHFPSPSPRRRKGCGLIWVPGSRGGRVVVGDGRSCCFPGTRRGQGEDEERTRRGQGEDKERTRTGQGEDKEKTRRGQGDEESTRRGQGEDKDKESARRRQGEEKKRTRRGQREDQERRRRRQGEDKER